MKAKLLIVTCYIFSFINANAIDLIVDQSGTGGAFTTLSAAIAASVPSDRILVYAGTIPYQEDFSINHSIQLLPAVEGVMWEMYGSIAVNSDNTLPALSEITIAGAHIMTGNIAMTYHGTDSQVNIVGCTLDAGFINFDGNGYYMHVANNTLNDGYVYVRQGKVVGNYINANSHTSQSVHVGTNSVASDVPVYVVGNHILTSSVSYFYGLWGVYVNTTSHYVNVSNNFIETNGTSNLSAIRIYTTKTGGGTNLVANNTIFNQVSNYWNVYVESWNSKVEVTNNVIYGPGAYGFYTPSQQINVTFAYNYVDNTIANPSTGFFDNGTNDFTGINTFDTTTGQLLTGPAIDGGNPDAAWMDLDFSVNDAGCYGGSFTKANFDAVSSGARTTFMIAPRRVVVGQTITISGEGFDY